MARMPSRPLLTALCACVLAPALSAQAAVDPSIAPRAGQLARAGQRTEATEMLGRYLATAPDDALAWRALGWFYLLDSREWHARGHQGDPPGELYLDFAAAALDQSLRAPTDSARLLRAAVDKERALLAVERDGWLRARGDGTLAVASDAPGYVLEAGRNLLASCPVGGIMVTGTDLEATAVFGVVFGAQRRNDLVLLMAAAYGADSLYRGAMARALDVSPSLPVGAALAQAAEHRPVCFTPGVPAEALPQLPLVAVRLLRVAGAATDTDDAPLSIVDLLQVELSRPNAVEGEVLQVYRGAAGFNPVLCTTLLLPLGVHQRFACPD